MVKNPVKHVGHRILSDNERGARQAIIEDLFYDFHRSRARVYKMNFVRGLFFGLGSVLGGTVLIALLIWVLTLLGHIPGIGDAIHQVTQSLQNGKK